MLAELAIANAAFAVIKEAVQNSGDIMNAGQALFDYFDAESSIKKKANEQDPAKSDLEEFMALEQLKQQQEELKQMMIYQGRGGMWQDWLEFKVKARQAREAKEKEAIRLEMAKRQKRLDWLMNGVYTAIIMACLYILYWFGEITYVLMKGSK
jgi:hypothetical protein